MSIYWRLIAVFIVVFSFPVFSDTIPATAKYFTGYFGASCMSVATAQDSFTCILTPCEAQFANQSCSVVPPSTIIQHSNVYGTNFYAGYNTVYSCPNGGSVDGSTCINVPPCVSPQVRNSVGVCGAPPPPTVCTSTQKPTSSNCKLPNNLGIGINCADGSTVYVPSVCPVSTGRWQNVFTKTPPMCSPLQTTNCTPLLFQRINDFASGHAIQMATAALALMSIPGALTLSTALTAGVAVEARALWDGVFHNSAGEVVDFKVAGDVPKSTMGDAISDFFKSNPTSTQAIDFRDAYNAAAPQAPIVVEPNTGVVHPVDSTVPLNGNQIIDGYHDIAIPQPLAQASPYINPESLPWMLETPAALKYDFNNMQSPINYPAIQTSPTNLTNPTATIYRSPNPIDTQSPFVASTPQSIRDLQPVAVFSPASSAPLPVPYFDPLPPASINPNPTGSPTPTSALNPVPDPTVPIDPAVPELPPVPPTIYPDYYKFFDFLPFSNPFIYNPSDFVPFLPAASACYYEIHETFHVPFLGNKHFDIAPCVPLAPLRVILGWLFSVLTILSCFFLVFRSSF